jgi:CRP-like cAMP-binding protein
MTSADRDVLAALLGQLVPDADLARAVDALAAITVRHESPANAWLLRAGDRAVSCWLIRRGLVRELYVSDDGEEHTRSFIAEGDVTGSLVDLVSGEPSITWIQTLEPVDALTWRYDAFNAACAHTPALHAVARASAERLAIRKTRREYEMLALSASERYARFLEQHPAIAPRVSGRLLASYLGVTPEHLSRLKRASPARTRARRARAP